MKSKQSYTLNRSITIMLIAVMLLFIAAVFGTMNTYAAPGSTIRKGTSLGLDYHIVEKENGNYELRLGKEDEASIMENNDDNSYGKMHYASETKTETPWEDNFQREVILNNERSVWGWLQNQEIASKIENIKILGTVKIVGVMDLMFSNLPVLVEIEGLEKIDTSQCTSMDSLFGYGTFATATGASDGYLGCPKLTTINIKEWDIKNVEYMHDMFCGCIGLTSLDLSGWNNKDTSSKLKTITGFLYGCENLTDLKMSKNFDTGSVTHMNGVFRKTGFDTVDVSWIDSSNAVDIKQLFRDCPNLTKVENFDKLETGNVVQGNNLFIGCESLQSIDVSKLNTKNMTTMAWMFQNCKALKSIVGLNKLDTSNVTQMQGMFYGCSDLTSANLSSFDTTNVIYMHQMFEGCTNLTSVQFSSEINTSNVIRMDGMFNGCQSLTSVDVSGFDTENVERMNSMFANTGLTELNLSKFITSNVTNMAYMFYGTSLSSIDVSNFDTRNVTNMGGMFGQADAPDTKETLLSIVGLNSGKFDTGSVTSMYRMFDNNTKLEELDLSYFDTSNVINVAYMFRNNKELHTLKGLEKFDTRNVTYARSMFAVCSKLKDINVFRFDLSGIDADNEESGNNNARNILHYNSILKTAIEEIKQDAIDNNKYTPEIITGFEEAILKVDELLPWSNFNNTAHKTTKETIEAYNYIQARLIPVFTTADVVSASEAVAAADTAEKEAEKALKDAEEARAKADKDPSEANITEAANAEKVAAEKSADAEKAVKDARKVVDRLVKLAGSGNLPELVNQASDLDSKLAEIEKTQKTRLDYMAAKEAADEAKKVADDAKKAADALQAAAEAEVNKDAKSDAAKAASDAFVKAAAELKEKADAAKKAADDAVAAAEATKEQSRIDAAKARQAAAAQMVADAGKTVEAAATLAKKVADARGEQPSDIKIGDKYVIKQNEYQVTALPGDTWDGAVMLIKAKNAKSVSIPKTVTLKDGKAYEVNRVKAGAFKAKKIRKVTLGANIEKLDKNAFKKSKATTIVLKTKVLKKASVKGALKGSKVKTVQVKVGSKKVNKKFVKKYKKIFTKKNAGKKVTVK